MKTPRGIRNNNPGNLDKGAPWQGLVNNSSEPRFCTFKDPVWGIRALAVTLITYHDKRRAKDGSSIDTIREVIERWAPPHENNTLAYVNEVSKAVGVAPDMIIDLHDYETLRPLVEAIIRHENGRGPLKTPNSWYTPELIEEGLRRAGIVKPVKAVKAVPVTKETAGATVTAGIGLAQIADVMPQVSAAMDKAQGNISSGDTVRIIFGVATILVAAFIAWSQVRKHQNGMVLYDRQPIFKTEVCFDDSGCRSFRACRRLYDGRSCGPASNRREGKAGGQEKASRHSGRQK